MDIGDIRVWFHLLGMLIYRISVFFCAYIM